MTPPRYAQLTYTSFDPPDGRQGGWQVKQAHGELTDGERALAMEHVSASLTPVVPLARFPSAADVAARPRSLLVVPGAHGEQLFVHACPAGRDGSGRPGNVFNHVLLDRDPLAPDPEDGRVVRAVERWGSDGWLEPFGPDQVLQAVLADAPPAPSGTLDRAAVARDLASLGDVQLDGLGALLDAVADALRQGRPVLLVADDEDAGAWWIAAVAHLAQPALSLRLSFTTFDRMADVRLRGPRALLTVVPRADVDAGALEPHPDWRLLDPEQQSEPDDAGWPTLDGEHVPFDDWSELALAALSSDAVTASDLLAQVDDVGRRTAVVPEAPPGWALSLVVAGREDLSAVWPAAARTVADRDAGQPHLDDAQRADRERMLSSVGGWPGHGADLVRHLHTGSAADELLAPAYGAYVRAVLGDEDALCAPEPPELPARPPREGTLAWESAAAAVVQDVQALAAQHDSRGALRVLRAVDLAERAGVPLTGLVLAEDLSAGVAAQLLAPSGPDLVAAAGPVGPGVVALLRPALARGLGSSSSLPGARLHPALAAWLWPSLQSRVTGRSRPGDPDDALLLELLVWACRSTPDVAPALRAAAARRLLEDDAIRTSPQAPADRAAAALGAVGGTHLGCDSLYLLVHAVGADEAIDLTGEACRVLLDHAPSPSTWTLAAETRHAAERRRAGVDDFSRAVLDLYRGLEPGWSAGGVDGPDGADVFARSRDVLLAGLRVWGERERVFDESRELLAPSLVVAAVRVAVWTGAGLAVARDTEPLLPFADEVPELLRRGSAGAVPMLRWSKGPLHRFPQQLFAVAARLQAGAGAEAVLGREVLATPVPGGDGSTLAEVVLRAHLHDPRRPGTTTPRRWVEWQLTELAGKGRLPAGSRAALTSWSDGLVDPAARRPHVEA